MVPTTNSPATFSPRVALARLGGFAAVGGVLAAAHLLFGVGLACPLLTLTGFQCPFCGATRAGGALARGDLGAAWQFNALVVAVVPVLAGCAIAWLVELAGGPALRPPRIVRPLTQSKLYVVVGVVAVIFMVVRNLG